MSNVDAPSGFRPTRALGGENGQVNEYTLAAANSIIGIGDLIVRTNAGVVDRAAAGATQIVGVAAESKAASSGGTILVYDNPEQLYVAQTDDGTGTLTVQSGINLNANIVVANATNGLSNMEIDESSGATTSTLPITIIRLYPDANNALGEFNCFEVKINNHVLSGGVGSDGV